MKKIPLKLLIRRFVLATSFSPFLQIYRLYYFMVTRIVLRVFKKYPEIKAAYLRRGGGKGEIMPLISDLDFAVVQKGLSKDDERSLRSTYKRLARATAVLDNTLEVYDEETFYKSYEKIRKRYRFTEAKETWKLLYGKDHLADLPVLPLEKIYSGLYHEIKIWWTIFSWLLLQARKNHDEAIIRNSVCYKTVSEILKMDLAFHHDTTTFNRGEALELAKAYLNGRERSFVERLEMLARKRFLVNESNIVEATKDFLLMFLDRFCNKIQTHDYFRSLKFITQRVDCPKDEWFWSEPNRVHIRKLLDYLREMWSHTYHRAYLVSGVCFDLDEQVLMVEVDPARFPTHKELAAIHLLHSETRLQPRFRVHLYLLTPHAAFKIDAADLGKSWQAILSPCSDPDIFDLLGHAEYALDGMNHNSVTAPVGTPLVYDLLLERKSELFEKLQLTKINRKDTISFLRRFWKAAQLCLIARSMQTDEIFYPLTLPSIKRGLTLQGISLPSSLQSLEDAYRDVIGGKNCDISTLIPEAVNYLKEIDS